MEQDAGWKKNVFSGLSRESEVNGKRVRETFDPNSGAFYYSDYYPRANRIIIRTKLPDGTPHIGVDINFETSGGETKLRRDEDNLAVDLIQKKEYSPVLSLEYDESGNLASCQMQAEINDSNSSTENIQNLTWQEKIKDLIIDHYAISDLPLGSIGVDPEEETPDFIYEAASFAMREVMDLLSSEEKEKYGKTLLPDLAFRMIDELVKNYRSGKLNSAEDVLEWGESEQFLIEVVDDLYTLAQIKKHMSRTVFQRRLDISEFRDEGFDFEELDIEKERMIIENKKHIRKETSSYGDEIQVQDNIFIIDRSGNRISVHCMAGGDKVRWWGIFPISVEIDKVNKLIGDEDSDFRGIKKLLPAELLDEEMMFQGLLHILSRNDSHELEK